MPGRRSRPGAEILRRQRAAVVRLKREVLAFESSRRHPYFRSFRRDVAVAGDPVPLREVVERAAASDVVYLGDFHADPACQRFAAGFLEALASRVGRLELGVEFLFTRQQAILDRRQRGEIDDAAFLRRVHYRDEWGYPWDGFREILDRARALDVPVHALDRAPRMGFDRLRERDEHVARRVAAILEGAPGTTLLVFFGESHLARGHLPAKTSRRMARGGRAVRDLVVFQDPEPPYWTLLERGERVPESMRLGEDRYAVFHTSPLERYERYRQVLERWRGDVPADDEVDLTPAVHHLIGVLLGWLGIRPERFRVRHRAGWSEELLDAYPEVYGGKEAESLLLPILEEHGRSADELAEAREAFRRKGALYEPRSNALFLTGYLPGAAAGEGARFLRAALTGRLFQEFGDPSVDPVERAYGAAYNEALAFLGSRLVDPATSPRLPFATDGDPRERIEWLEAHRRFEASRRLTPPEAVAEPLRRSRAHRRMLAKELGERLGRRLFQRVESGQLGRRELRILFSRPLDPPAARPTVLRLLRAKN